jgi:UPF0755 protein
MTINRNQNKTSKYIAPDYWLIILSSFVLFLMFGLNLFFAENLKKNEIAALVKVPEKMTFKVLADSLEKKKLIDRKYAFLFCGFVLGVERKIKAGTYKVPYGLSNYALLQMFYKGSGKSTVKITFPEGITLKQIAKLLSDSLNFTQNEFLKSASDKDLLVEYEISNSSFEGYLMPDTYEFFTDSTPEEAIRKMASHFQKFYQEKIKPFESEMKFTKNEIVTLASIIEAETNVESERFTISGVYHNRLKRRMRLEADPTIAYVIPDSPRRLLYKDLKIVSPYNTYLNPGLPPGPINSPGQASLIAAVKPEKHNYIFFVSTGKNDGHKFSKSYSEHQRAVREYRKAMRR